MPRITVDGQSIECKDRQMILQAVLDAKGGDTSALPHYCYHPGLSIPASCRICLVEVEGIPKLVPSCQTPIRDGMVVHTKSTKAVANQKQVMEYLLVNHPLDCPVCDQAGECYLQDYSYQYGRSQARFEEDKHKKPKKDVGEHIVLYNDRCIMCTRCVRFTREVSGTSELYVDGRGHKEEIDIFPGKPLNNKLSGNVADICPVGALLDKDFLFKQRVWFLKNTPSISPVDAGGENITIGHNEGRVYRIKPRFNAEVNQWWISDDTRYAHHALSDPRRLVSATVKTQGIPTAVPFPAALDAAVAGLKKAVTGGGGLYAVLSPMLTCEEAFLLGSFIRSLDPSALLVLGPVPTTGDNETFKHATTGKQTFVIQAEKVPNRRGIERVLALLAGNTGTFKDLEGKTFAGGWITGGYLSSWVPSDFKPPTGGITGAFTVVQDTLGSRLSESADVFLPGAFWAEKEGTWENHANKLQPFAAAIPTPEGALPEGLVYLRLHAHPEPYSAKSIRQQMGEAFSAIPAADERPDVPVPAYDFAEL